MFEHILVISWRINVFLLQLVGSWLDALAWLNLTMEVTQLVWKLKLDTTPLQTHIHSMVLKCGKLISWSFYFLLYMALIWIVKKFSLQPCCRVFVLLGICAFKHSNKVDTKQDIYLKNIILALSGGAWVEIAKIKCLWKYHLYSMYSLGDLHTECFASSIIIV